VPVDLRLQEFGIAQVGHAERRDDHAVDHLFTGVVFGAGGPGTGSGEVAGIFGLDHIAHPGCRRSIPDTVADHS
jgi:hypothetical protein